MKRREATLALVAFGTVALGDHAQSAVPVQSRWLADLRRGGGAHR